MLLVQLMKSLPLASRFPKKQKNPGFPGLFHVFPYAIHLKERNYCRKVIGLTAAAFWRTSK